MIDLHGTITDLPTWVGDAADIAQIAGIVLAAVALWIAVVQLSNAADSARIAAVAAEKAEIVSEAQAVLALDQVLAQDRFENELRPKLKTTYVPANEDEEVTVRRYVATFERLGLLLQQKVISLELADAFYGSRLERLVKNCAYARNMVVVKNQATKGSPAWRNFVFLWRAMETAWKADGARASARRPSTSQSRLPILPAMLNPQPQRPD